jgi:hypothetical protein
MKRTFGKKFVLGYGSFNQTQMKNCMPTPTKGMKRLLSKHFKLYIVDEFLLLKYVVFV